MSIQFLNEFTRSFLGNTTAMAEEAASAVAETASVAMETIAQLSYVQIGAGLAIGGGLIWGSLELDSMLQALRLMRDDMSTEDKARILTAVRAISLLERRKIIHEILTWGRQTDQAEHIIYGLLNHRTMISAAEQEDIETRAQPLMREDMHECEKELVRKTIRHILPTEREDLVARALLLIGDNMNRTDKWRILSALTFLPRAKLGDEIAKAQLLIQDNTKGIDIEGILFSVQEIPLDIIRLAQPVMRSIKEKDMPFILTHIREIPIEQRADRITRVLKELEVNPPPEEVNMCDYVINLLTTPLDQPFREIQQKKRSCYACGRS